jgi:hypothetical protein
MQLRDRVDVIVEAGLRGAAVGEGVWDVTSWDSPSSTWSGLEPSFTALDGWTIESLNIARGRGAGNRRHPAGTAELVLVWNSPAGNWSFRPSSPITLGQELRALVRPKSRITGAALSDPIPLFRGAVRSIRDGWQPARRGQMIFRLTAQLTDRFADLGAVNLPEASSAVGLGDTTDERLARILELAGISTYYLRAAAGLVEHQSSTFARNLLDEAQVTVEGETGQLYIDREGFFYFRERLGTGTYPREASAQLEWSNLEDRSDAIGPTAFSTGSDLDDVVNQVSRARTGGSAITAVDADSSLRFGLRTNQQFDLTCRFDADVTYCAEYWLAQLADRTQRIDGLTAAINPDMPDDRLLEVLDIELGDRHHIAWGDGEVTLEGDLAVQGVAHRITGSAWAIGVNLWAYAGEGLEPGLGSVWGTAIWGVSEWG